MPFYVKTYASREEGMIDKRDNSRVIFDYEGNTIAYETEPTTGYVEDGAFNPANAVLIEEQPLDCRIYRFIQVNNHDKDIAPIDHNYNTGLTTTLWPKRDFSSGELYRVCWFADQAKTEIVIKVDIVYNRDPLGFPIDRTTTRTWFREDGTEATPTKMTVKEYYADPILQLKEGVTRRGNLRTNLIANVMGMMMAVVPLLSGETEAERQARVVLLGRNFLALYKKEFNDFVDDSNKAIINLVLQAQDFWLELPNPLAPTTTIRDYVIAELSSL